MSSSNNNGGFGVTKNEEVENRNFWTQSKEYQLYVAICKLKAKQGILPDNMLENETIVLFERYIIDTYPDTYSSSRTRKNIVVNSTLSTITALPPLKLFESDVSYSRKEIGRMCM